MNIKTKLMIMAIIPGLLLLVTGSMFIVFHKNISGDRRKVVLIDKLVKVSSGLVLLAYENSQETEEQQRIKWVQKYNILGDILGQLSVFMGNSNDQTMLGYIVQSREKANRLFASIEADEDAVRKRKGKGNKPKEMIITQMRYMLLIELQAIISHADMLKHMEHLDTVKRSNILGQISISFLIVLALGMPGFSLVFLNGINKSINRLIKGTEAVFSGDLDYRVGLNSHDELGHLSMAFDRMTEQLNMITVSRDELVREMDKRKKAGNEIKRLVEIVSATTDFVGIADTDGRVTYVNPAGRKMLGIGVDEDITKTVILDYHSEQWKTYLLTQVIPLCMVQGAVSFEADFLSRSGKVIPFSGVSLSHKTDDGTVEYLSLVARDITDRKRIESELIAEKVLSDTIIDSIPGVFYIFDSQGKFFRWNKNTELFTGYSSEEMAQLNPLDFFSGEDRNNVRLKIKEVFETGKATLEADLNIKNGMKIPYMFTGRMLTLGSMNYLVGLGFDIQELKRVEKELKRFIAIIETTSDFVGIADAEGRVLYANPAGRKLIEISMDEDLTNTVITDYFTKETGEDIKNRIVPLSVQNKTIEYESEFLTRSGRLVPFSGVSLSQKAPDGTVEFIALIARDISERKWTEEQINHLMVDLKRSNKELEQLAYVASHDLQEPLRKIASFTDLFAKKYRGKIDDKADSYIDYIVDGATRMSALINDLLIYSRVVGDDTESEIVDCNNVIQSVLNDMEFVIFENKAMITWDDLPSISCNQYQVVQLFQNLISNAIKYHKEAEPAKIHVSAARAGSDWIFSFKDNGIGIEHEYVERIFALFQRLHSRTEYSGTGIGLAVCKKIVEKFGGEIWVESEYGKGSNFYFSIPSNEADE